MIRTVILDKDQKPTAEQIKQYTEQFKYPETISIEEVRAASKYHVITF